MQRFAAFACTTTAARWPRRRRGSQHPCLALADWSAELRLLQACAGLATRRARLAHVRSGGDRLACGAKAVRFSVLMCRLNPKGPQISGLRVMRQFCADQIWAQQLIAELHPPPVPGLHALPKLREVFRVGHRKNHDTPSGWPRRTGPRNLCGLVMEKGTAGLSRVRNAQSTTPSILALSMNSYGR